MKRVGIREQRGIFSGWWVEWSAEQIRDPVLRLRYLKLAAPPPQVSRAGRGSRFLKPLLVALVVSMGALFFLARASGWGTPAATRRSAPSRRPALHAEPAPSVWLVDQTDDSETYSDGLRIDKRFAMSNRPRAYVAFRADQPEETAGEQRSQPAGIVFHTTESRQAPFEAQQNPLLRRIGESLIDYVRRKHAYNYLVDRFGRVYRLVVESDAADHAGYSVWCDEKWVYLNLNDGFLGVSLETETRPGQVDAGVNPAQVRAAAVLTEMLRGKYGIAAANCVTHAQVSVNPSNMRVGYHTDWASSFPFAQMGLPDNYARALPAVSIFGFEYDSTFLETAGPRMAAEAEMAEADLQDRAARSRITPAAFRKGLQDRYRRMLGENIRASGPLPVRDNHE